MCKRFYVEVKGLGDDGVQRLVEAGLREDSILVIDEPRPHQPLIDAIHKVCNVTYDEMVSKDRTRNPAIARLIFVHFALIDGDSIQNLAKILDKDRTTVAWYIQQVDKSKVGDRLFATHFDAVEKMLDDDPKWCPPLPKKAEIEQKKGKKRKSRRKKRLSKAKELAKMRDKLIKRRQLEIKFEF